MLNIHTKIFEVCDQDEFWLMCHIAKRIGSNMACFPSNKTLCKDTKWGMTKMQAVKKSCVSKGLISMSERKNDNGQTSNLYKITNSFLSVYVNFEGKELEQDPLSENDTPLSENNYPPLSENDTPPYQKTTNEVLASEVLASESNNKKTDPPKPEKSAAIFTLEESTELAVDWMKQNAATVKLWMDTARITKTDDELKAEAMAFFSNYRAGTSDIHEIRTKPVRYFSDKFPGWLIKSRTFQKNNTPRPAQNYQKAAGPITPIIKTPQGEKMPF